jgi:two-component system, chemotaxis family, protein-glutamate methylesterase/glutaminase
MKHDPARDIVVIGASAGGVSALLTIAESLSAEFPAAVLVVLHVGSNRSLLPQLMTARGKFPAHHAVDGEPILSGRVYIAPPNRHLLIEGAIVRLSSGPKEHHTRPAIDPLFRSAALNFGAHTIGVVLSGRLDDGTAGLQAIKALGGLAVVQDPNDACEPSMPESAIAHVEIDARAPAAQLADVLVELLARRTPANAPVGAAANWRNEHDVSLNRGHPMLKLGNIGTPSVFTCPDCNGVLWELAGTQPIRFRCHTGHAYSLRSLVDTQAAKAEDALWAALRVQQEQTSLLTKLTDTCVESGNAELAERYRSEADQSYARAQALSKLLAEEKDNY